MTVVLRMSIISFNGSLHRTLWEGIGAVPWSEAPMESLRIAWKRVEWTVVLLERIGYTQLHKIGL